MFRTKTAWILATGVVFGAALFAGDVQAQTDGAANASGDEAIIKAPPGGSEGYYKLVEASSAFRQAAGDDVEALGTLGKNSSETKRMRQQYARQKASALNLARAAIKLPFRQPPMNSLEPPFPAFAGFRQLARGFALESQFNADEGRFFRAASSGADSVEMGVQLPHGGSIIGTLVGYACEAIGRKSVWAVTEKLDAKSARVILRRLQVIETNRAALRETLVEEKRFSLTMLRKVLTDMMNGVPDIPEEEMGAVTETPPASAPATADSSEESEPEEPQPPAPVLTPERIESFLQRQEEIYDALIAASEQPYSDHAEATAMDHVAPYADDPGLMAFDTLVTYAPVVSQLRFKEAVTRTHATLQMVALALQAYHKEQGDFPAELRDLTRGDADTGKNRILARIPADPFSPKNQTVRYRRLSREKYLLYSVGPDGKDDNGKPLYSVGELTAQEKAGRPITAWNSDQRGDMVVGANVGPEIFHDAPPAPR